MIVNCKDSKAASHDDGVLFDTMNDTGDIVAGRIQDKGDDIRRQLSPEDELYKRLTGKVFKKAGTAYERLATAVASIINGASTAMHDVHREGYSTVKHQLDGLINDCIVLEAKDYSIRQAKVGLEEVQNHQGAMADLEGITKGVFASATDYTSEARKYAEGTTRNPKLVPTDLMQIRHSTEDDEKNRIKSFQIRMHMYTRAFERGRYELIYYDAEEKEKLAKFADKDGQVSLHIGELYDSSGNFLMQVSELGIGKDEDIMDGREEISGTKDVDAYIKVENGDSFIVELVHIKGIKYKIPVTVIENTFTVEPNGDACMLVRCDSLGIDRLVTDNDLKAALDKLE